jgi:RCR-type E3 ubiquitin transferase
MLCCFFFFIFLDARSPPLCLLLQDFCMICFTEPLGQAPSLRLACGHILHAACLRKWVSLGWDSARITFGFLKCPLCQLKIVQPELEDLLGPLLELEKDVRRKAVMRIKYMNLHGDPQVTEARGKFYNDLEGFALSKLAYYQCYKCKKAYYGGQVDCAAAAAAAHLPIDRSELVCSACCGGGDKSKICPKHGTEFSAYKCRYCCSTASWFCFGTTHFCEVCHNHNGRLGNASKADLAPCPAGPGSVPLEDVDACPLGVKHPPTGDEFFLGCTLCSKGEDF